jgi:ribosomal protein L40E
MPSYKPLILGALIMSLSASFPAAGFCNSMPDSVTLNQSGKLFQPFAFNHAKHIELLKECAGCHHHTTGTLVLDSNCVRCHANSSPTKVVSCRGCHSSNPFTPDNLAEKRNDKQRFHVDKIGLKGAMHQNCVGCHSKQGGPTGCEECHPRTQAGKGFYNTDKHAAPGHHKAEH